MKRVLIKFQRRKFAINKNKKPKKTKKTFNITDTLEVLTDDGDDDKEPNKWK